MKDSGLRKKIAILLASSVMQGTIIISPVLSSVGEQFPAASATEIQMIMSVTVLAAIVSTLICGFLMTKYSKKSLILAAFVIESAAAAWTILMHDTLQILYLERAFFGLGHGLLCVVTSAYIAQHFDGLEKSSMLGLQSAVLNGASAVLSYLAGLLCARIGWVSAFAVYFAAIPLFFVVWFMLPADTPVRNAGNGEGRPAGGSVRLYLYVAATFAAALFYPIFSTNISLKVASAGIGDTEIAGTAVSIFGFTGILVGVLLGRIIKVLKNRTVGIMTLELAGALVLLAFAQSRPLLYLGSFLYGLGFASRIPAALTFASFMSPKNTDLAVTLIMLAMNGGECLSPIVVNAAGSFFGGGPEAAFLVAAAGCAVVAVVTEMINPLKAEDVL